jgi:UDP-4-amino-4,6-dideoxy-N-acetyl-beta-L-altrosamine N-acetyltransferase
MKSLGNLRSITEDDLELIRSWRNHPAIASKMYKRHEISADEHTAWWVRTSARQDQGYFMYENAGEPLGVVGFTEIDPDNGNCFWAFYASPTAPRGTGSCMEFLALEHVFQTLGIHKLSCEVLAFNEAVIRLHKKFGFQVEGVFRDHHKLNDKYIDIVRLGLLGLEWSETRDKFAAMFERNSEKTP